MSRAKKKRVHAMRRKQKRRDVVAARQIAAAVFEVMTGPPLTALLSGFAFDAARQFAREG